jgi:hypothetical protein
MALLTWAGAAGGAKTPSQRFRTQICANGASCKRQMCFFAHGPGESRNAEGGSPGAAGGGEHRREQRCVAVSSRCMSGGRQTAALGRVNRYAITDKTHTPLALLMPRVYSRACGTCAHECTHAHPYTHNCVRRVKPRLCARAPPPLAPPQTSSASLSPTSNRTRQSSRRWALSRQTHLSRPQGRPMDRPAPPQTPPPLAG